MIFRNLICSTLLLAGQSMAGYNPDAHNNLAIYWGPKSVDTHEPAIVQKNLAHYYADSNVDVILLAFVEALNNANGHVRIKFTNQLAPPGRTNIEKYPFTCPAIGKDMLTCQKDHKTTLLLSRGGANALSEKGFSSEKAAEQGAVKIWQMFGPKQTGTQGVQRPFGDAVVDGFDFDFEHEADSRDPGKKYYLSTAPQCAPATSGKLAMNIKDFDMWFVQFYNNPECHYNAAGTSKVDFKQWDEWAPRNTTNMFVGLPGGPGAAPSGGYVGDSALAEYLGKAKSLSTMRGAMLWDASQAWANSMYHLKIKDALAPNKQ